MSDYYDYIYNVLNPEEKALALERAHNKNYGAPFGYVRGPSKVDPSWGTVGNPVKGRPLVVQDMPVPSIIGRQTQFQRYPSAYDDRIQRLARGPLSPLSFNAAAKF